MITVTSQQSTLDLALQYCGSLEAAFDLALLNNVSITDDLSGGQQLDVPAALSKDVTKYYAVNDIRPATAITIEAINEIIGSGEGIGFWAIGYDFVVS